MEIAPRPVARRGTADGKSVSAWYRTGVGYVGGGPHVLLAEEMAEAGLFVPPAEDGGEVLFSSLQDAGWLRVGVIDGEGVRLAFVFGTGIGPRSSSVRKVVGDLLDMGAVGFGTSLEVCDERADRLHRGTVGDSL